MKLSSGFPFFPHFFSARFFRCLIFLRFLQWIGFIPCMGWCWFWAGPMWRRRRPTKWAVRPLSAPAASKLNRAQHARLLLPVHTYMYTYTYTRTTIHAHNHTQTQTNMYNTSLSRGQHAGPLLQINTSTNKHRYATPFHKRLSLDCIGLKIFGFNALDHNLYSSLWISCTQESKHLSSNAKNVIQCMS